MVQVHHDEGVANRIDPESCADAREGIGEALTGERIGQPLSRESTLIPGADVVRTRRPCLAGLNREPLSRIGRLRIGYGIDPDKIISPGSNGPSFSKSTKTVLVSPLSDGGIAASPIGAMATTNAS